MKTNIIQTDIIQRAKKALNLKNDKDLSILLGVSKSTLSNWNNNSRSIDYPLLFSKCEHINFDWLLTGEGEMLRKTEKDASEEEPKKSRNLIPFYDDVVTVGGRNSISASMDGHMPGNDMIDAGDWFTDATAAIRHYGDSMEEYPSGCILALKELHDRRQIVWGRNYCIETDEMRVTKRLQPGAEDYLMAYSSNKETYPDGHLVHEPFRIYKDTIRRIFMVIGCITKEYSSGPVMIKRSI